MKKHIIFVILFFLHSRWLLSIRCIYFHMRLLHTHTHTFLFFENTHTHTYTHIYTHVCICTPYIFPFPFFSCFLNSVNTHAHAHVFCVYMQHNKYTHIRLFNVCVSPFEKGEREYIFRIFCASFRNFVLKKKERVHIYIIFIVHIHTHLYIYILFSIILSEKWRKDRKLRKSHSRVYAQRKHSTQVQHMYTYKYNYNCFPINLHPLVNV